MPVVILQFDRAWALGIFSLTLFGILFFEIGRKRKSQLSLALNRTFGCVIRPQENVSFRLTGAPFVLMAALLLCLLFPPIIAATALTITLMGDSAAALIGRRYGWTRISSKSLEGSLAFFMAGTLAVGCIAWSIQQPMAFILSGIAAAFVAAVVELFARLVPLDDNLTVPFAAAYIMWIFLS